MTEAPSTSTTSSASGVPSDAVDAFVLWLEALTVSAYRRAVLAGRSDADAADISQEVALYALTRGRSIMDDYPSPEIFAAVRTFHAGVGWDRRNGSQGGAGAMFGRQQQSLYADLGDGLTLHDTLACPYDTAEEVQRRVFGDAIRLKVATTLDPRTAQWVWDVKGHGMTVSDVARRHGVPRETVSRAVNSALRQLKPVLGEFVGG